MRCSKAFACFLVVFLLVSSCAWAIPGIKKAAEPQQPDVLAVVTTTENSENEASVKYVSSEELLEILNKSGWVLGGEKLDKVAAGVEAITRTNEEQNNEIERLAAALRHEQSTKFFADFGAAVGFGEQKLLYGVTGDMGIRIGSGFMIKTGATYMVGEVGKIELPSWSLQSLTLSATVGWEW